MTGRGHRNSVGGDFEAWRREEAGALVEELMYPSDAAWAGIYDQMLTHTDQETSRRLELAAEYG